MVQDAVEDGDEDDQRLGASGCCGLAASVFNGSLWMLLLVKLRSFRRRLAKGPVSVDGLVNAMGSALMTFYVSVCVNCLIPFNVMSNPSGIYTLVQYPHIIYGSTQWAQLVAVSAVGLFVYVGLFLPYLCWAVYVAPERTQADVGFLKRHAFLLPTHRADRWWWGVVGTLRSVLLAAIPIVGRGDGTLQAALMTIVLALFTFAQVKFWPYKTQLGNTMSSCFDVLLTLIAALSMALAKSPNNNERLLNGFILFFLTCAGCVAVGTAVYIQNHKPAKKKTIRQARVGVLTSQLKGVAEALIRLRDADVAESLQHLMPTDLRIVQSAAFLLSEEVLFLRYSLDNMKRSRGDRTDTSDHKPTTNGSTTVTGMKPPRRVVLSEIAFQTGVRRPPRFARRSLVLKSADVSPVSDSETDSVKPEDIRHTPPVATINASAWPNSEGDLEAVCVKPSTEVVGANVDGRGLPPETSKQTEMRGAGVSMDAVDLGMPDRHQSSMGVSASGSDDDSDVGEHPSRVEGQMAGIEGVRMSRMTRSGTNMLTSQRDARAVTTIETGQPEPREIDWVGNERDASHSPSDDESDMSEHRGVDARLGVSGRFAEQ